MDERSDDITRNVQTISSEKIPEDDRYPGATVEVDGEYGKVETIIGGRARVDFDASIPDDEKEPFRTISSEKIPEDDRYPGATVEVDGEYGKVETIIGGRARVDFSYDMHDDIGKIKPKIDNYRCEIPTSKEKATKQDISIEYRDLDKEQIIDNGDDANIIKATIPTPGGDMTLAIKEPRLSGTLHTEQVDRMLQEAETWSKLDDHSHIVDVVDYGSEPMPWIAMEYMDSGHLGEWSGAMDIPQALWTAIAVTKGVRHAHRKGVAHLDLKPENVLFHTVEKAWDMPKVADWGLSKHLLDHSKSIGGYTPTYSAPEQLEEEYGQPDDITDVYQLGAVFYELFTGHPPFESDRTGQIIQQVLTEEPNPPSEVVDVPEALDDILLTALAKEKVNRYDDIVYLRDNLKELFDKWR